MFKRIISFIGASFAVGEVFFAVSLFGMVNILRVYVSGVEKS
jgi:hypothetical protein